MAVTIEGIPESITREQLVEWLAQVGIDAAHVRSLWVNKGGISADVRALDAEGKPYVVDDEVATHRVVIRVTDEPEPSE